MKTIKTSLLILTAWFTSAHLWADELPFQPGDPGSGSSAPLDDSVLLIVFAVVGIITVLLFKKKKAE